MTSPTAGKTAGLRRTLTLVVLAGCLAGCTVGRSWFQMDSNSSIPFFGVDLLPKRRTSQNLQQPSSDRDQSHSPNKTDDPVKPAGWKHPKEVKLPKITDLLSGEEEIPLSFEGPPAEFTR